MENTQQNRFGMDEATLFLAGNGDSFTGPFKPSEIFRKLENREIAWVDYCFREAEGKWIRICDHSLFLFFQPESPKLNPKIVATPPPVPAEAQRPRVKWFLFQNEIQTGPYPEIEIQRLIQTGQVTSDAFVWQEAFSDWKPIGEVSAFPIASAAAKDRRVSPRKPLLAKIYLTNDKEFASGVCRDISVGGMQILTETPPGKSGDRIHLNVMPPDSTGLAPFVAHGVIVRILEDQRGFSFRFTEINDEARAAIERYIS
jgi:PilZ domain/GYF domain 2